MTEDAVVVGTTARVTSRAADRIHESVGGAGFNIAAAILASGGTPLLVSVVGTDLTDAESAAVGKVTRPPLLKVLSGRTAHFDFTHARDTEAPRITSDYGVGVGLTQHATSFTYEDAWLHVCCRRPIVSEQVLQHAFGSGPRAVSIDFIESSVKEHIVRVEPFLASIAWIFVNEREYDVVKPYLGRSAYSGHVLVTYGRYGASVLFQGSIIGEAEPTQQFEEAVDPTGAGDATVGAFLVSLLRGAPIRDCVRRAVDAGSRAVTAAGMNALLGRQDG